MQKWPPPSVWRSVAGERWDHLIADIQSRATPVADLATAGEGFLRLVVVDLALRVFALVSLTDLELPGPETPVGAQNNGDGTILR